MASCPPRSTWQVTAAPTRQGSQLSPGAAPCPLPVAPWPPGGWPPQQGTPRVKRLLQPAQPRGPVLSCPQHVTSLALSQAAAGAALWPWDPWGGRHPTPAAGPREQRQDLESRWDPMCEACLKPPPSPAHPSTEPCHFHPQRSECAGVAPGQSLAWEYSNVARNGVTGRFNLVHRPSRAGKVRREVLNIL